MDLSIALILAQDGVVNGAVYALLALSLVLVFAVTRVILIPQGEFVAYGALTYATLDAGGFPPSAWLTAALGVAAFVAGVVAERRVGAWLAIETLVVPAVAIGLAWWIAPLKPGPFAEAAVAILLVAPVGAYVYRIGFQPLARASVLVLLIAAVGVHLALNGLGLVFFGPEGSRGSAFSDMSFPLGDLTVTGQSLWIVGLTIALMGGLAVFFEATLTGKALRATAFNRLGARLVGIRTGRSGRLAFWLAGGIGALSGVLVAPLTTVYYDSGFLIGLKGFVAAIVGGLVSYPAAAAAAIGVGLVESFASFWASAFKEVIVFTAIIPVLLWRSLRTRVVEDE